MEATVMFVLIVAAITFGQFTTQSISSTLFEVLTAAEWNSMILVCDTTASECPTEDVLSVHPAVFVSIDINNHSHTVQMFERHAASRQLNWLVFCTQCETLLDVINTFKDTHELQGYFKYKYQWMLVTNYNSLGATTLGDIMNLLLIDTDQNVYTSMFWDGSLLPKTQMASGNACIIHISQPPHGVQQHNSCFCDYSMATIHYKASPGGLQWLLCTSNGYDCTKAKFHIPDNRIF